MKLNKLKEIIANYQKLLAKPTDKNYASIIAVEEILKQKQIELQTKTEKFESYVSTILHNKCNVEVDYSYVRIHYNNSLFSKNNKPNNCLTTYSGSKNWIHSNPQNKKIQHPQTIYNKDMTNVNTTGVKFSPFKLENQFTDVILDGTIIDDYETMINLNTVKSYNNQTVIPTKHRKI